MKILIVEDSDVAIPMKHFIEKVFAVGEAEVTIRKDLIDLAALVKRERPEVIMLDLTLPGAPMDTVIDEYIPALAAISDVIVCSSRIESQVMKRCIIAGANDYVRKEEIFAEGFNSTISKFRSRIESAYYRNVRSRGMHSMAPSTPNYASLGVKSSLPCV